MAKIASIGNCPFDAELSRVTNAEGPLNCLHSSLLKSRELDAILLAQFAWNRGQRWLATCSNRPQSSSSGGEFVHPYHSRCQKQSQRWMERSLLYEDRLFTPLSRAFASDSSDRSAPGYLADRRQIVIMRANRPRQLRHTHVEVLC